MNVLSPKKRQKSGGFTIVELLIVIVIIGILVAITIVAYNGVQQRAKETSMVSDLTNTSKQLELVKVDTGAYPTALSSLNSGQGVKASQSATTFQYLIDNTSNPQSYCLVATNANSSYSTSNGKSPSVNSCSANVALNGSFETDTSGWVAYSTTALSRTNARASDGSYSLLITSNGSGGDRYVYANIPTSRTGLWNVTADVYLEAANPTDYSRGMWVNNIAPTTSNQVSYNTTSLNSWQPISLTYTSPSGSTGLWVRFYVMPGNNIYVDNLKVTPI